MRIGVIFSLQADYGHGHRDSHRLFWSGGMKPGSRLLGKLYQDQFSISFGSGNIFFATALNAQEFDGVDITHIVSMHNDVVPEHGWLDMLVDEMEATDADFLSVVLPIKDLHGLSSTAIDSLDDPFCVERRLTMTEIYDLPETFSNADCGYPDRPLLVNTGLWIMNFTKDWRKNVNPDGSLALNCTSPDRIRRRPPDPSKKDLPGDASREATVGRWEAQHSPADWYLSRHLHHVGAKVLCTRKIKAVHIGDMPWTNMNPWGDWKIDEALKHKFGGVPIRDRIAGQTLTGIPINFVEDINSDNASTEAGTSGSPDTPAVEARITAAAP